MPVMLAGDVHSREDFIRFARDLARVAQRSDAESTNLELAGYLDAVSVWTADMPGYFANERQPVPDASWALFAMILEAALGYE